MQKSTHDPHSMCSLCGRLKSDVDSMVAGEIGSLCSDCLINAVSLLDDASRCNDKDKDVRFIHRLLIATLSRSREKTHCDEKLKNYILEVGDTNPEMRLKFLNIANSVGNTSLIIGLLSQVPREHWTLNEIIFWMYAQIKEGRYSDALNYPDVKRENCSDAEFRLFTLNRIVASVEMKPESEEIVQHLADLECMRRFYADSDYPYPQDETLVLPNVLGTMAKCHYLLGNYESAFSFLNEEIVASRPSSYRELLRGQIHAKLGQMEAAKLCWQRGVNFNERDVYHDRLIQELELITE